jgi:hypothetical protein
MAPFVPAATPEAQQSEAVGHEIASRLNVAGTLVGDGVHVRLPSLVSNTMLLPCPDEGSGFSMDMQCTASEHESAVMITPPGGTVPSVQLAP